LGSELTNLSHFTEMRMAGLFVGPEGQRKVHLAQKTPKTRR
jgi:hypothetical protein